MKSQKGITLVALVITIIVLLILAGVSISLVVGQNGVLTRSTDAVLKNQVAEVKEKLTMSLAAAETTYYSEWTSNQATTRKKVYVDDGTLKDELDKVLDNKSTTVPTDLVTDAGTKTTFTITNNGNTYKFSVGVNATNGVVNFDPSIVVIEKGKTDEKTITL